MPSATKARRNSRELSTLELLRPTEALAAETGKEAGLLFAEAQDRFAEGLLAPVAALIGLGCLLLGQFSRFGVWRQVILAVVLVTLVKGVESASVQAVRDDPALWPVTYLPATLGFATAAALLWLAARPRRVGREALA
jgi:lipopolysaccharide export system permease protein